MRHNLSTGRCDRKHWLHSGSAIGLAAFGLSLLAVAPTARPAVAKPPASPISPVSQYSFVELSIDSASYLNGATTVAAGPLSGATVVVNGATIASGAASNEFTLSMSPNATLSVTISCAGYQTQVINVTSGPNASTVTQTAYLTALPTPPTYPFAGVSGTVVDTVDVTAPATSTPVAGATVTLTVNGGTALSTTTDSNGNYTIPVSGGIPTGASLALTTSAFGYTIAGATTAESGTSSTQNTNYTLGSTTLTPNNKGVFSNGSMSYVYGCNYPSWEYADFAPNYLAYWYPGCPEDYDFGNVESDPASPNYNTLVSIQQNFTDMGALTPVNGNTPMRTVRWFLFSQMDYTLLWTGESGNYDNSATAKVATTGANHNTINPSTGTTDPLLSGITQSGLDYTTFTELGLALNDAAQNNIKILFTFATFYDLEGDSGNHRAVGTVNQVNSHGTKLGSTIQDSYFNNAVIPALQYITNWEKANGKNVVFAYDALNEPDQDTYGQINGNTLTGTYINGDTGNDSNALLQISDVQAFVTRAAAAIHTYGNGALATGDTSQPQVVSMLQGCGLDFYCAHYYGFWNDATASDPNTGYPTAWSLGIGLPNAGTIGSDNAPLDKACVIEEMQTAEQTSDMDGDGNHLTANWILNAVLSQGYAGALGWGYTLSYADNNEDPPGYSYDPLSHWSYFQPYFVAWPASNTYNPATGTGVVIGPN